MKPGNLNRRYLVTSLWAIALAIFVACGSGDDATPTPESIFPPQALENTRAAMAEVPEFEFKLTHPKGSTSLPGGLSLRSATGAVIVPRQLSVSAGADLGRLFVKVDAVVIDGETWMTNPLTRNWASIAPEDSPFSFLDPVQLVTDVLDSTTDPAYPADSSSDGEIILLDGKVPSEALRALVGTVLPGEILDVRMHVDRGTSLLHTAVITGRLQPEDEADYVRRIDFEFDGDISIEPPL